MKRLALLLPLLALAAAPALARFGFDAADPVCTTTVGGEYRYLARLRGADGAEVKARRQGSTFVRGFDFPMDVWKLSCGTNAATVYLYGYGDTNSLAAPEDFRKAFGETLDAVARMTDITVRLGETAFIDPPAEGQTEIEAAIDAAEAAGANLKKAAAAHGVPWHDIFDDL